MYLEVEHDHWGNADQNHPEAAEDSGGSGTVDGRQPPVPPAIKLEPLPDPAILAVGSAWEGDGTWPPGLQGSQGAQQTALATFSLLWSCD